MSSHERILAAIQSRDYTALVAAVPYATHLGVSIQPDGDTRRYHLAYRDALIGNVRLPALHGGVVAGFLEISALFEVLISQQQQRVPRGIDFSVDYLRSAGPQDCHAHCRVVRQGRRIAQIQCDTWQDSRHKPVASARAVFLLQDN